MSCEISIIIPLESSPGQVISLLHELKNQLEAPACEILLMLRDADSEFITQVHQEFANSRCAVVGGNLNHLRNEGLKRAEGELILFLNQYARLTDLHLLRKHLLAHRVHPEVVAISGSVLGAGNANLATRTLLGWLNHQLYSRGIDGFYTTGLPDSNFSLKRKATDKNFYFDESLDYAGSEQEFAARLLMAGLQFGHLEDMSVEFCESIAFSALLQIAFERGIVDRFLRQDLYLQSRYHQIAAPKFEYCGQSRFENAVIKFFRTLFFIAYQAGQQGYPSQSPRPTIMWSMACKLFGQKLSKSIRTDFTRELFYGLEFVTRTSSFRYRKPTRLQENNSALRKLGSRRSNYDIISLK